MLLTAGQARAASPPPPPSPSQAAPPPPVLRQVPPPRVYGQGPPPPPVYVPAPARVYGPAPPSAAAPPPPLPIAMRIIYAPFYAAGLILRYGVYYVLVAPLEVLGRTLDYGVDGGVAPNPNAATR